MGVKNLWDILDSCKKTLPLHHLQNKRLCVDLSCWLIQFQTVHKSPPCAKEKLYLQSLFHRLRALIALNCNLIFVTDGAIPSIKLSTYRRRLGSSSEAGARDEAIPQAAVSVRRNMGSEFSCMIKEAKALGLALGVPCLDGLEEAEAQCALLNSASLCDGCFSADSDIFLFGARTVYRDILLGEGGHVICYEMVDIERKLGFGRNSLITLALLLGSDYSEGVHGFGRETACQVVKEMRDDTILHQIVSKGLTIVRKRKGTKKTKKELHCEMNKEKCHVNGISLDLQNQCSDDQYLQVIDAYLRPKCHSADSELVKRVCTQYPFQRTLIQQICEQYFGWSTEKTNQYILPKIAERDLRRFSNLRSASLELGERIPLDKLPVICPVLDIVKPRKLRGKECFEVSWQNMDGLQTSVVPADLLESACPEKITEFIDKKDEGKKKQYKRLRTRKPNKATIKEVNKKLQGLLLSIESENSIYPNSRSFCHRTGSNPISSESNIISGTGKANNNFVNEVDMQLQDLSFSMESHSNGFEDSISCHLARSHNVETDVIDLSSPPLPLRPCKIAKSHKDINHQVDIIDICDSDTDGSPEHQQKARELRLFLDSIRNDLY